MPEGRSLPRVRSNRGTLPNKPLQPASGSVHPGQRDISVSAARG
jgi:hypothetical protein